MTTLKIVKRVDLKWVEAITRAVLITGLLFLLQGCGARWHLSRAIAKDPTILDRKEIVLDTIIITENKAIRDTFFLKMVDTIKIERDGVRVELTKLYDTIQISAECLPDTIRLRETIEVPQVVYKEKSFGKMFYIGLLISFLLYTFVLIRLLNK